MKQAAVGDFVFWRYCSGFEPPTYLGAIVDKVTDDGHVYADASRWGPMFCVAPVIVTSVDEGSVQMARLKRAEERMHQAIATAKASFEAERDSIMRRVY